MSIARDRANRSGTDPLQIDNTKLITDSGDLKVQDISGNEKKLIAEEIHVGTGSDKVILKRDSSTGKVAIQTQASGEAPEGGAVAGTTIYATTDLLPTSPSDGQQALVTANNFMYIAKSNGWYKIAEITNTTPSITSAGNATYQFLTDGTPVSIEITATDAEVGTALQYKYVVSSGSIGSTATVTSSATSGGTYSALAANTLTTNKFFKVTPSTNSAHAGTFSLTFSASDGVAVATSSASEFTLQFDVSGSYKFDGSGDYITTTDNSSYTFGTGAFSVECFYNVDFDTSGSGTIFLYDFGSEDVRVTFKSGAIRAQLGSETQLSYSISGNTLDKNTFHHHALIRHANGKVQLLHNGSEVGSYTGSTYNVASTTLRIGDKHSGSKEFTGYISNFRVVKGSTAYSPTSVTSASSASSSYGMLSTPASLPSWGTTWTLETWIYITNSATYNTFFHGFGGYIAWYSGQLSVYSMGGFSADAGTFNRNQWHHIALVNNSGSFKAYIDGVQSHSGTANSANNIPHKDGSGTLNMMAQGGNTWPTFGYMADTRLVIGTAVYTGAFTPPSNQLTKTGGTYPSTTNVNTSIPASHTYLLTNQTSSGTTIADNSDQNYTMVTAGALTGSTTSPYSSYFTVPTSDLTAITNTKLLAFTESAPENITTGSIHLNGGNLAATSSDFALGTGDFTIETWFKYGISNLSDNDYILDLGSNKFQMWFAGGEIVARIGGSNTYSVYYDLVADIGTLNTSKFYHLALVRNGSDTTMFLDGIQKANTNSTAFNLTGTTLTIGSHNSGNQIWEGYVTDLRIVKGKAVYTGAFTPPSGALTKTGGTYPSSTNISNPTASETVLLIGNNSSSITDVSDSGHTFTATGSSSASSVAVIKAPTDISTASNELTPYGSTEFSYATPFEQGTGGSTLFYGTTDSSNDYLTIASSSEFAFGTNDFTIEFFLRAGTNTSNYTIIYSLSGSTGAKRFEVAFHNSTIQVYTDTGAWRDTGYTPTSGAWEHFAFQRDYSENTLKMFVDGKLKWSVSNNRDYDENQSIQIGSYASGSYGYLAGYLSNFRIVNGSTVYTPTTTAAGLDFTNTGRTTLASHAGFDFGTNDFTIEFFYKWGSLGYNTLLDHNGTGSTGLTIQSTHVARSWFLYGSVATYPTYESSAASAGIWHHYAIVRNGNVVKMYRDGVETLSKAHSSSIGSTFTSSFGNTASGNAYPDTGSVSNFRVVKGTALYTSAGFTPPSSPLTAVSGTALLLFQENSGSTLSDGSSNNVTVTKASQHTILTNDGPFYDEITVPTSKLTAVTNTKLLTCNDSNVINDASSSSHNITISGNPIATRFHPF
tara:strand:+ start:5750 stop:9739 length:3990 start_codon:yes stop_codon:yes gene_type:complete